MDEIASTTATVSTAAGHAIAERLAAGSRWRTRSRLDESILGGGDADMDRTAQTLRGSARALLRAIATT